MGGSDEISRSLYYLLFPGTLDTTNQIVWTVGDGRGSFGTLTLLL